MKRTCFIFAVAGLLIGFAIGYGLLPKGPSGILTEFYHEVASAAVWGDTEGFGTTMFSMIPATFPQTFKMSTITTHEGRESITRHTHRFRAQLARETTMLFFISATEPVHFKILVVGREAGGDFVYRTILRAPNITSYHDLFRVRESGVYKFVFERVQVKPVSTVTFTALDVSSSPLPSFPLPSTVQRLYISARPDSLSIRGTIFHYVVILTNLHDTPVSSYIPDVTVTLTEGNTVFCSWHITFNMTSPITLGPNEERSIYDGVIAIAECAPKGTYWLQAAAGPCWVPGEYPPTEEIVFITQPTLITLK